MPIADYTDLFTRLKPLIEYFNLLEERQTKTTLDDADYPLPYIRAQILAVYTTLLKDDEVSAIEADFQGTIDSLSTLKNALLNYFDNTLYDLAEEILSPNNTDPAVILDLLAEAMVIDAASILTRTVSIAAADYRSWDAVNLSGYLKAHTANLGDGKLVYCFKTVNDATDERALAEIMQCLCTSGETFTFSGEPALAREQPGQRGSGSGTSISPLTSLLTNGDFETWTNATTPGTWTVEVGAVGQETVTPFEGLYDCELTQAAAEDWTISQPIALVPNTVYVLGFWARKAAGATGTMYVEVQDGDDVQVITAELALDMSTFPTTWPTTDAETGFYCMTFVTPGVVGDDWKLVFRTSNGNVANVFLDNVQLGEMVTHNYIQFALCGGSTPFGIGDRFGYGGAYLGFKVDATVAIIQQFLARCYGKQLPSSGAPTITDP